MEEKFKEEAANDLRLFIRLLNVITFIFLIHFFISYIAARAIVLSYATGEFARVDAALRNAPYEAPKADNLNLLNQLLFSFPTKSLVMPSQVGALPEANLSHFALNSFSVALLIYIFGFVLSRLFSQENYFRKFFDGRK